MRETARVVAVTEAIGSDGTCRKQWQC